MSETTTAAVMPSLDSSILVDVRVACNVDETDDGFDLKLIPLINTQMMMAHQFGVGSEGFRISGLQETWRDWLGSGGENLMAIQTWLGYSVLLLFDPPDNATVLKSYQDQIQKMEWMLCNKSCLNGYVKDYVPSKAAFYDRFYERIAEATADED